MCAKMSPTMFLVPACWLLFFLTSVSLISCGGGGGSDSAAREPGNIGYVTIDSNTDTRIDVESKTIYGTMFSPDEYTCDYCPLTGPDMMVTWSNETTGETGLGRHSYRQDRFYTSCICLGQWAVEPNFIYGDNLIKIKAELNSGGYGESTMVITRLPRVASDVDARATREGIVVSWSPVSDAKAYEIQWSNTADVKVHQVIENVVSPYLHSGLTNNSTYYYRIVAKIGEVSGQPSDTVRATAGWLTEYSGFWDPNLTNYSSETAVAADTEGKIHISTSFDELGNSYLTRVGEIWESISLYNYPVSFAATSLALDETGSPHIASNTHSSLVYYSKDPSGSWISEALPTGGTGHARSVSLDIDSAGSIHLAYIKSDEKVYYTTNRNSLWETSVIDSALGFQCQGKGCITLAVDSTDNVHMAFVDTSTTPHTVNYSENTSGDWITHPFDATASVKSLSLSLSWDDAPFIIYATNTHDFMYAEQFAGNWTVSLFPDEDTYPKNPRGALDQDGNAHIVYEAYGGIYYLTDKTGQWFTLPIGRGSSPDVAVDKDGYVHVSHIKYSEGTTLYTTNRLAP